MTKRAYLLLALASVLLCSLTLDELHAQTTHVFLSGHGLASNPCTFTQPCRSFQQAHNTVAAGGVIEILDPAAYGPIVINKSVSIQGRGFASIGGTEAIIIQASDGDRVSLRGLIIDGVGTGTNGIRVSRAGLVSIEDSIIRGYAVGIDFEAVASATLVVTKSTIVANNVGLKINTSGAGAAFSFVDLKGVNFISNQSDGLQQLQSANTSVADCMFVGNGNNGLSVTQGDIQVMNSVIANNGNTGVNVSPNNAVVTLDRTQLIHNLGGNWVGTVTSFGNNNIDSGPAPAVAALR